MYQHPKALALCAELDEPLADAYVTRLWSWAQRYAPDGRISARTSTQLESALGWRGSITVLVSALVKCGWLDEVSDALLVHDWADHQAYFAEKAKKDANKKRQRRRRAVTLSVTGTVTHLSRVTAPPTRRTDETDVTNETNETNNKPLRAKKPRAPVETDALVVDFLEITNQAYRWQGAKDGVAFAELRRSATLEEIRVRWKRGLMATGWRHTATVAQLLLKWNDLATDEAKTQTTTPTAKCANCGAGATAAAQTPKGEVMLCYANDCLEMATNWQRQHNVDAPWLTDLGPWLSKQKGAP